MHIILQYIFATRNALISGSPAIVAQTFVCATRRRPAMPAALSPSSTHDLRVKAVLAMLHGDSAAQVSARYGIGRSALYKFRHRALAAISAALSDHPRGPKRPHNRVSADLEQKAVSF